MEVAIAYCSYTAVVETSTGRKFELVEVQVPTVCLGTQGRTLVSLGILLISF